MTKIKKLGARGTRWIEFEDLLLRALRPTCSNNEIEAALAAVEYRRSSTAIDHRSSRLGLTGQFKGCKPLNQEALESVLSSNEYIAVVDAIDTIRKAKAPLNGSKRRWTEADVLKRVVPVMTEAEVLAVFEKMGHELTRSRLRKQCGELGLAFEGIGYPKVDGLPEGSVRRPIARVLAERSRRLAQGHGRVPYEPTRWEKAKRTNILNKAKARLIDEVNYLRAEVEVTEASTGGSPVKSEKASIILCLSDVHIGRRVWDETRNLTYNMEIAFARLRAIPDRVRAAVVAELGGFEHYDECVVLLGGDMIDGDGMIFPGQAHVVEDDVIAQVHAADREIWTLLLRLRQMFPTVRVICARGNHGRGGGRHANPNANWDNALYGRLALRADLNGDTNLSIANAYGDYCNVAVKGWQGHLRHKGPPHAGTGGAIAKWAGWQLIHGYDFVVSGHYHHIGYETFNGTHIFRNGCLTGGDEFSESLAYDARASQLLFTVRPDKLPAQIVPIYFDEAM